MRTLQRHHLRHLPYGSIVRVNHKGKLYRFAKVNSRWWAHTLNPKIGLAADVMENLATRGRVEMPDLPDHLLPAALRIEVLDRPVPVEWDAYSGTYMKAKQPDEGDEQ